MHPAELPLSALSCTISILIKSMLKIQKLFSTIQFNVTVLYTHIWLCCNLAIFETIVV